jgi:hypothetical protein
MLNLHTQDYSSPTSKIQKPKLYLRDTDWVLCSILTQFDNLSLIWSTIRGFREDLAEQFLVTLDRLTRSRPESRTANAHTLACRKHIPRDKPHCSLQPFTEQEISVGKSKEENIKLQSFVNPKRQKVTKPRQTKEKYQKNHYFLSGGT